MRPISAGPPTEPAAADGGPDRCGILAAAVSGHRYPRVHAPAAD
ncbi:hypothetical protein [Kitasatospora phosalacinea]|nr:hypothetical protein [Kitasatospora phosalacinea]